jgi:anti-anti-sigma factor
VIDEPGQLDIQIRSIDQATVLAVSGDLDSLTAPALTEAIGTTLAGQATSLIVDLSELDFLASAGMTVLVQGQEAATKNSKRFCVVANGPTTSRPMELVGLNTLLNLHRTLDAALRDTA